MNARNMRELGVHLIAFCHNDACGHQALIDVSGYLDVIEIAKTCFGCLPARGYEDEGQTRRIDRLSRSCRLFPHRCALSDVAKEVATLGKLDEDEVMRANPRTGSIQKSNAKGLDGHA
jgi:hypothetical protein